MADEHRRPEGGIAGKDQGIKLPIPTLTVGVQGSGGTGETLLIFAPFLAKRAYARAAEPLPALNLSKGSV